MYKLSQTCVCTCFNGQINGVPSCANKKLLTDILRTEWGFKGYVVSDEMALEWIITGHHYANDNVTAAATAVEADVSLEISPDIIDNVFAHIGSDVQHSHRVKS
ncbi:hypothetical protein C0Q70_10577 [Pomacea canaliculata]|uniref:Glycoside hydrolase family 3 N-terminal domain-containing protein n=1 Tax=Pomacea canaliculata TaxID=400727 RepID=A0A2T7P3L3_POMCA|nr:hypothetical protein C0Q70_10577 [Pomacea canaliculata]